MQPLISASMIVRDEERHLHDCLASLQGVVDEMVVVDTGSVDGTVSIAESFGARVLHHPWTGDFAEARNVGLDAARGQWILYIDADERLQPVARSDVEALLAGAEREVGFRVRLHPHVGWTPYLEYRIWRNDPRIRFEGVIHEKIVYSLDRVAEDDGRVISDCMLTLDHVGYEGDQTHKHHRNLPLLEEQLAAEPDNIFNWTHLGRVLSGLSRHDEAEAALQRAVALARKSDDEVGGVAFATLIHFRFDIGGEVDALVAEARDRYPDNWSIVWLEGQAHLRADRNEEAAACFRMLLDVDREIPGPVSYHGRLFGEDTHAALGLALFRMGRYIEAAEAYAEAERLDPRKQEYRVKRLLAESRAAASS